MNLSDYSDLLPEVQRRLKAGCEPHIMLAALRHMGREFCERTSVWVQDLPTINLVAGQTEYSVISGDMPFEIAEITGWRTRTTEDIAAGRRGQTGRLEAIEYQPATFKATFASTPSAVAVTGGLIFAAKLLPGFNLNEIPQWIIRQWAFGLAAGAAWDISNSPSDPRCYDAEIAQAQRIQYEDAVVNAIDFVASKGKDVPIVMHKGFRMMGGS